MIEKLINTLVHEVRMMKCSSVLGNSLYDSTKRLGKKVLDNE